MKKHLLLLSVAAMVNLSAGGCALAQDIGANFVDEGGGNGNLGTVYAGTGVLGESFVAYFGEGAEGNQSEGPTAVGQGISLLLAQNTPTAGDYFQNLGGVSGGATDLFDNSIVDDAGTGFTITLSGLVSGHLYDVAVYSSDNGTFTGGGVSWKVQGTSIGSTTGASGATFATPGNYLIDTNVAANGSGDIVLVSNSLATFTQISGVGIEAVPEPSTWALLLGGLGMVAWLRLRARRS